jgi:hypothetical protein
MRRPPNPAPPRPARGLVQRPAGVCAVRGARLGCAGHPQQPRGVPAGADPALTGAGQSVGRPGAAGWATTATPSLAASASGSTAAAADAGGGGQPWHAWPPLPGMPGRPKRCCTFALRCVPGGEGQACQECQGFVGPRRRTPRSELASVVRGSLHETGGRNPRPTEASSAGREARRPRPARTEAEAPVRHRGGGTAAFSWGFGRTGTDFLSAPADPERLPISRCTRTDSCCPLRARLRLNGASSTGG